MRSSYDHEQPPRPVADVIAPGDPHWYYCGHIKKGGGRARATPNE